jgi:hypothetical protein
MGRAQRDKGARGERELGKELTKLTGLPVTRLLGQARDGGADFRLALASGEVQTVERVRSLLVECKRHQKLALPAWLRQVDEACGEGELGVVAHRRNREGWQVTMTLATFVDLVSGELVWIDEDKAETEEGVA